jgi:hypothetical protein
MTSARMKRQSVDEIIRLLGKRTDPNPFLVPNGSMRQAMNVWMTRPGLLSKRRGFSRWSGVLTFAVNKLFPYETGFIAHVGTDVVMKVSSAGAVSNFGSIGAPPDQGTGWRTRGCIAGKDFFFNTNDHVYRLSGSSSTPVKAGGLIAPSFDTQAVGTILTGSGGFLADGYAVAYRYLLGSKNSFGREILGPVSGRISVTNQTGTSGWSAGVAANVTTRALLPPEATTSTFIRWFRSAQVTAGSTPDDDLQLVYEKQLTAADVAAGYVELVDIVPDALRGPYIYTSPNAGEGILQNNDPPPNCAEIVAHKNRVWYLNTRQPHSFNLQILAVGGTDGIQAGDKLQLFGNVSITMTATTGAPAAGEYLLVTSGTVAYNIEQTALNLVTAINKWATNTAYWAQYVSGPLDTPGKINIYQRSKGVVGFTVAAGPGSKRDCFNPALLPGPHTMDLARAANVVTATVTSGTQNFKVGESIAIFAPTGTFGTGPFTVLSIDVVGPSTFLTYAENGINASLAGQVVFLVNGPTSSPAGPTCSSVQEARADRAYYSKAGEFDAVPRTNFIDLGGQDKDIVAAVSANDQLWTWKRDGIIRLVGDDGSSFTPIDVDRTVVANARETVVKFLGDPVGLTDRGFMRATMAGLELIDGSIHKELLDQMVGTPGTYLEPTGFAVPYDNEGLLLLFFASGKDKATGASGLLCNTGFTFNAKPGEWSDWSWDTAVTDGNGKTCGAVLDGVLYFGDRYLTSGSSTYVYKERKARTSADFKDTWGDNTDHGITWIAAPTLLTHRAPGYSKLFEEVVLLFEGTQPASLTVDDANEWASGGQHTILKTSGYASRFWPFVNASRGRALLLTITHNTISEGIDLAGIQVSYQLEGLEAER